MAATKPAATLAPAATATTPAARRSAGFWGRGEPLVWVSASALGMMLLLLAALLVVIAVNGLGVFWPSATVEYTLTDGSRLLGRPTERDVNPDNGVRTIQLKTANREYAPGRQDFCWVDESKIAGQRRPPEVTVFERLENGDFYGYLREVRTPTLDVDESAQPLVKLAAAVASLNRHEAAEIGPIRNELSALSDELQAIGERVLRVEYRRKQAPGGPAGDAQRHAAKENLQLLREQEARVKTESQRLVDRQHSLEAELAKNVAIVADGQGQQRALPLTSLVRWYEPNAMSIPAKLAHYVAKIWELLTDSPRESNTEGGLFPAIFGTLMLMFLMAISGFPLGVLAGVYLGEYARDGTLVRIVRVAVNNLAGIPSIVYGIFGLGFFVYGVGGVLDHWLYPERTAAGMPTYGTGGLLWASLTLGLLTMPVVIVATEEALRAIPRGLRESSLALGATKFQTLVRVLLPMASPGIMTGFILAMARAAGEVAPLMITGVVKLAPSLPLDGQFPFFHPDRKFMHLGFHIYDIGFQSPNVEAAKPMVYVTTMLLVLLVLLMSSVAIALRNRMRRKMQLRTM